MPWERVSSGSRAECKQFSSENWEKFSAVSEPVQGDILYMLGEMGHPDARGAVESVLAGDYSADVKEAAEEALEKIKNHA